MAHKISPDIFQSTQCHFIWDHHALGQSPTLPFLNQTQTTLLHVTNFILSILDQEPVAYS